MRSEKTTTRPVGRGGLIRSFALVLFVLTAVVAGSVAAQEQDTLFARLDTDMGSILLVFYPELAPITWTISCTCRVRDSMTVPSSTG